MNFFAVISRPRTKVAASRDLFLVGSLAAVDSRRWLEAHLRGLAEFLIEGCSTSNLKY
jgi:hypothetical protein